MRLSEADSESEHWDEREHGDHVGERADGPTDDKAGAGQRER